MKNRSGWLIVAISGVTCGGKTTLAKKIKKAFPEAHILNQDSYFYPDDSPKHVKVPNMDHNNYDIMSSLDMERMTRDITAIVDSSIDNKKCLLIIEGFTVLNHKPIAKLCDVKYHIHLSKDQCLERRKARTYDPPDIPGYFEACVWPEYEKCYAEVKRDSEVVFLDGMLGNIWETVFSKIETLLKL